MPTERVTYPKLHGWTQGPQAGVPWERFAVPTELDLALDEARGRALPSGTVVALSSSSHHEYLRGAYGGEAGDEIPDAPMDVVWTGVSLGGSAAEDAPPVAGHDPNASWLATWQKGSGPLLLSILGRASRAVLARGACAVAAMCLDPNQPGAEGRAARDATRRSLEVAEKWAAGGLADEVMAAHVERVRAFDYDFARAALLALGAVREHPRLPASWAGELAAAASRSAFRAAAARASLGSRRRALRTMSEESLRAYQERNEAVEQASAVRAAVGLGEVMLGYALAAREGGAK